MLRGRLLNMRDRELQRANKDLMSHSSSCSGQYDQEYLDYLRALLSGVSKHGLVAYVVCTSWPEWLCQS
jgi:hypothetical protein